MFVATFAYRTKATGTKYCAFITYSSGSGGNLSFAAEFDLRLAAPLGSRTVIDVKTGEPVGIATGQLPPAPSYLPSGYRQDLVNPLSAATGFYAVRQYQRGTNALEIRLRSAPGWTPAGSVIKRVDIDGHAAVVSDESYERCVSWSDDQHLLREVCSEPGPHGRPLPVGDLDRVARSLSN